LLLGLHFFDYRPLFGLVEVAVGSLFRCRVFVFLKVSNSAAIASLGITSALEYGCPLARINFPSRVVVLAGFTGVSPLGIPLQLLLVRR